MKPERGFTLVELMITVAIVSILAAVAIPQYIKYVKRTRTSEALNHVKQSYDALAEWYSNPSLGDGAFLSSFTQVGAGGLTFKRHFPNEAGWLTSGGGDLYYTYSFRSTTSPVGGTVPLVQATARNPESVFGLSVRSLPGGGSTVSGISASY